MVTLLLSTLLAQPLNLNSQGIKSVACDGGLVCTKSGTTVTIINTGSSSPSSGGAPVDGGYVVWTSVGSTNERLLSNGTNTTIDTATPGQIQVDLSGIIAQTLGGTGAGSLTCAAGERLTSNGTAYSCSALPAGSGYSIIEDEATPLTARTTVNFTGAGVTCTDTGSKTQCSIPGGGGGGGLSPYVLSFGGF